MSLYCMVCGSKLNLWDITIVRAFDECRIKSSAVEGSCLKCSCEYICEKVSKYGFQIDIRSPKDIHVIFDSNFYDNLPDRSLEEN